MWLGISQELQLPAFTKLLCLWAVSLKGLTLSREEQFYFGIFGLAL